MLGGENVQLSDDAQQLKDWVERGACCFFGFLGRDALRCVVVECAAPHLHPSFAVRFTNTKNSAPSTRPAKNNHNPPKKTSKGVVDAVRERYLKRLYFGIAADPSCADILEEFVFTFAYGSDDGTTAVRIDAATGGAAPTTVGTLGGGKAAGGGAAAAGGAAGGAGGTSKPVSVRHVKNQIFRLMRTLVELCSTLEDVPEERHIFMRLTYHVSMLGRDGGRGARERGSACVCCVL